VGHGNGSPMQATKVAGYGDGREGTEASAGL